MRTLRTFRSAVLLLSCLIGSPALADDSPLPRVGRVSAVDGTLALRPAGGEWADSGVNDPVAAGMSVRTAAQGRAELRVGAEIIALATATELEAAPLDAGGTPRRQRRARRRSRRGGAGHFCRGAAVGGGAWCRPAGAASRLGGNDRLRGAGRQRQLGNRHRLRRGVVAADRRR